MQRKEFTINKVNSEKKKNILGSLIAGTFILFAIWLILTGSFHIQEISAGLVISFSLALVNSVRNDCSLLCKIFNPKRFIALIKYLFIFFFEMIKANIEVAGIVIHPRLPINPGVVRVKTVLKSNFAKMILANSITLTPGTLTVDVQDDVLLIHWIDVVSDDIDEATKEIVHVFEKHLEAVFE